MVRIAVGKAALDAGMAVIGLAILVGHHTNEFVAAHFRFEGAADAAISACRYDRMFGLANCDHRLLKQAARRAGLHAGAARDAFGLEEGVCLARHHAACEAAPLDRQRDCPLDFVTGADTAVTHNALRRIVGEVGI